MIVVGAVDEAKRGARRRGRIAQQADVRGLVLDQIEAPFGDGVAADLDVGAAGLGERHLEFDQALGLAVVRRRRWLGLGAVRLLCRG